MMDFECYFYGTKVLMRQEISANDSWRGTLMKKWFLAKSVAVKVAIAALSVAIVGGAGTAIYCLNDRQPNEITVISDEDSPLTAKVIITDDNPLLKDKSEETNATEEKTEEVAQPEEAYVKTSNTLENGDFSDGINAWEVYSAVNDNITYTTDDGYFEIEMKQTGAEDWHVQLKQTGIRLEKGKWYVISFDAKSSLNRQIACAMQRDGMIHNDDWTPYATQEMFSVSSNWSSYSMRFQMPENTDNAAVISFSLGKINGRGINTAHTVAIDNVALTALPDNWTDSLRVGDNLIGNADFSYGNTLWDGSVVAPGAASVSFAGNKATFDISNPGTVDWHVQLNQGGINLAKDTGYRLTFNASSTAQRTIKIGFMDTNYINWYGGEDITVGPDTQTFTVDFYNAIEADANALLMVSMGKIDGENTPASTITLSDFNLVKCDEVGPNAGEGGSENTMFLADDWMVYDHEGEHVDTAWDSNGYYYVYITDTGLEDWHVQLQKKNFTLLKDKWYTVSFYAKSTVARQIKCVMQRDGSEDEVWTAYSGDGVFDLNNANEWQRFETTFKMTDESDAHVIFNFSFGSVNGNRIFEPHIVAVTDMTLVETEEPQGKDPEKDEEMLVNGSFTNKDTGWYAQIVEAAKGTFNIGGGKAIFDIKNPGSENWHAQLKQSGLKLVKGAKYEVTIDAEATVERNIAVDFLTPGDYKWLGGSSITLGQRNTHTFVVESSMDAGMADLTISMGKMENSAASKITFYSISVKKIADPGETNPDEEDSTKWILNLDVDPENSSQYKGGVELDPAEYIADYAGKDIKVTAKLKASMYFGGAISASTDDGWFTGTKNGADNPGEYTWTQVISKVNGIVKLDIWWSGADTIEIVELKMEEVGAEGEDGPTKWIVNLDPDPNTPNQYKGGVEVNPADYVEDYEGKTLKITAKLNASQYFGGAISGNTVNGWTNGTQNQGDVAGEYTWVQTLEGVNGVVKIDIWWSGANTIEILDVAMEVVETQTPDPEPTPEPEKWIVTLNPDGDQFRGGIEFNPADYVESYEGKNIKLTVKFNANKWFGGALGGNTAAGWEQTPQIDSGEGEVVWEHTFTGVTGVLKADIWYSGAEKIEIVEVKMEEVAQGAPEGGEGSEEGDEGAGEGSGEGSQGIIVNLGVKADNPEQYSGGLDIDPSQYVGEFTGKNLIITLKIKASSYFGGVIAGTTGAGWSQSDMFDCQAGEVVWQATLKDVQGWVKADFWWSGAETIEILEIDIKEE